MSVTQARAPESSSSTAKSVAVLASVDSHVGPRLVEDLRPHCPPEHLEAFDAFASIPRMDFNTMMGAALGAIEDPDARADMEHMIGMLERNSGAGHYDPNARLADMDRDGVVTELIFHGSQNGQPLPFLPAMGGADLTWDPADASPDDREMVALGQHIYNAWLAEFCSSAPERLLGLASVPLWDLPKALAELEFASGAGLRGVNFPAPRMGFPEYDDPVLEPFWSAVEHLDIPLVTHAGAAFFRPVLGPQMINMMELEGGGWPSRRGLARMIFGGVFERHPGIRLVMAEQAGDWWDFVGREMDSSWKSHRVQLKAQMPKAPSQYLTEHVYIGASFTAPFEAGAAVEGGYETNMMWGRDYPHIEGTFQNLQPGQGNMTHLSLRHGFAGLPSDKVQLMIGGNFLRVFGLDAGPMTDLARRIGAPTLDDLSQPIEEVPDLGGTLSFRTIGAWG